MLVRCALMLVLVLSLCGPAVARSSLETPLDLSTQGADVLTVLREVAKATGKRLFVAPDVEGLVSLEVRQVPAWQVLQRTLHPGFDFDVRDGTLIVATPEKLGRHDLDLSLFLDGTPASGRLAISFAETEWGVEILHEGDRAAWRVTTADRRYPWCGNSYETHTGWLEPGPARAVVSALERHPVLMDPTDTPPPELERVLKLLPLQQRTALLRLTDEAQGSGELRRLLLSEQGLDSER